MILTTLLFLASQSDDAAAVSGRYRTFIASHPVLSVDVAISGVREGKGVVTIRRREHAQPKVDWTATISGTATRFITDGVTGIDIDQAQQTYDRLPLLDGSFPGGRLVNSFGFPFAIVAGNTPFDQLKSATKTSHKGELYELQVTQKSAMGEQTLTADFGGDGRLTRFSIEKGAPGHMSTQTLDFSNYRFGHDSASSAFSVEPPLGYTPLAFDIPLDPRPAGFQLPATRLSSGKQLDQLPDGIVAFVDAPCPEGLAESLARLNKDVPVTIVEMKDAKLKFAALPVYFSDSKGFDAARVGVTPQFYLVRKSHIVQTWQGFRADAATAFEHEVHDALKDA